MRGKERNALHKGGGWRVELIEGMVSFLCFLMRLDRTEQSKKGPDGEKAGVSSRPNIDMDRNPL